MNFANITRLSSVALVAAGVSMAAMPVASAAPAQAAIPCLPGTTAYPPGVCTYNFFFFVPVSVVTKGNTITINVNNHKAYELIIFWLSPRLTASAVADANGQAHVTVDTATLPTGVHALSAKAPNGAVISTNFTVAPADSNVADAKPASVAAPADTNSTAASTATPDTILSAAAGPGDVTVQSAAATADAQAVAPASYVAPMQHESTSYVLPAALLGGTLVLAGTGVVVAKRRKNSPEF